MKTLILFLFLLTPNVAFAGIFDFPFTCYDAAGIAYTTTVNQEIASYSTCYLDPQRQHLWQPHVPNSGEAIEDTDNDGFVNNTDNCIYVPNLQADHYGLYYWGADGRGDACQPITDSDGDVAWDTNDNCSSTPNTDQKDTDLDGYGDACDADYNNDGMVNILDFVMFRQAFGRTASDPGFSAIYDSNGDGAINIQDFVFLRKAYGKAPGPSGMNCKGHYPCIPLNPLGPSCNWWGW